MRLSGNPECGSASKPHKGLALAAAGLSTLALTCVVCCVVPFLAPVAAAGAFGAVLTFTAGFHGIATGLASFAAVVAWRAIVLRRGAPVRCISSAGMPVVDMNAYQLLVPTAQQQNKKMHTHPPTNADVRSIVVESFEALRKPI